MLETRKEQIPASSTEQEPQKEQADIIASSASSLPALKENNVLVPLEPADSSTNHTITKDKELLAIENILAEGLEGAYHHMQPNDKENFKKQGEVIATTIQKILHETKQQVQKIFQLILSWLRALPRVNKFFLEQEAKIKTDKIIALAPS